MNIVKVKYYNESVKDYTGREWTYYTAAPLSVGDIVTVPVKDRTSKAQVSSINIPDKSWRGGIRYINYR